jgi:hypothetical protein
LNAVAFGKENRTRACSGSEVCPYPGTPPESTNELHYRRPEKIFQVADDAMNIMIASSIFAQHLHTKAGQSNRSLSSVG